MLPADFILLTSSIDYPKFRPNRMKYDPTRGGSGTAGVLRHLSPGPPQPGIICLSLLPELQCSTPCLAWVRLAGVHRGIPAENGIPMVEAAADVIRWSMQGGASIPHCPSGTIYRAHCTSDGPYRGGARIPLCTPRSHRLSQVAPRGWHNCYVASNRHPS
jgi:hypothetical protein